MEPQSDAENSSNHQSVTDGSDGDSAGADSHTPATADPDTQSSTNSRANADKKGTATREDNSQADTNTDTETERTEGGDAETPSLPPLTEFLTQYDTRRFREELSDDPLLDSTSLLETPQQLIDQSTATIGRPTRTYPPTARENFPALKTITESATPRGDRLRLQMPYQQSLHGPLTITVDVPAVSAFERVTDRPEFFCDCDPSGTGIHDTNFLMDTHAGMIDLSAVYGIYDERSGLNYGLRIVTDTDGVIESGQFIVVLEGQEASVIITPAELQLLIQHTACSFVTPLTDSPTETADCEMLAQHYARVVTKRGLIDSLEVTISEAPTSHSESADPESVQTDPDTPPQGQSPQLSLDARCPIETPRGQVELFQTDAVRIASADATPVASVGVDFARLGAIARSEATLTTPTLSSVPVSLTPETAEVPPTTVPLPVFADGLALGQYQPVSTDSEEP